jgi:hypothetical protein
MSLPVPPIGPRSPETPSVSPIERSRSVKEREPRDEDDRRQGGGREQPPNPQDPPVADADGHIDVLA